MDSSVKSAHCIVTHRPRQSGLGSKELADGRWCRVPAPHFGHRESGDPTLFLPKQDSISPQGRTSAGSKAATASFSRSASASRPRFSASQVASPPVLEQAPAGSLLGSPLGCGSCWRLGRGSKAKEERPPSSLHSAPPHAAEARSARPRAPRSQSSCWWPSGLRGSWREEFPPPRPALWRSPGPHEREAAREPAPLFRAPPHHQP